MELHCRMSREELRNRLAEIVQEVWVELWGDIKSWNCDKPEYPDFVIIPPATVARLDRDTELNYLDLYSTDHQLELADKFLEVFDYYLAMNDTRSL